MSKDKNQYEVPPYSILDMFTGKGKVQKVIDEARSRLQKSIAEGKKYIIEPANMHFVSKGWGYEHWIYNGPDYCGKLLYIVASKKTSYHYHNVKDEVLYIQSGKIRMTFGETDDMDIAAEIIVSAGSAFHIPTGLRHCMEAIENTLIFEISTHHEDADSIRVIKGS